VKNYALAERYAGALNSVVEDGDLEAVLHGVQRVRDLFDHHHELHACLANPAITIELREKVLDEVIEREGVPEQVKGLLHTLLERRRMEQLDPIAQVFEDLVDERLNRVTAQVTVARPLTDESEAVLREGLEAYSGKQVRLVFHEDPSIIGGIVAKLEGRVIDGSLRTRVQKIKDRMIAEEIALDEIAGD
jgi:F-type H+-transporting ATPase subunit delta